MQLFQHVLLSQSMSPTLENRQEILVNRFIYSITNPKPNDIVVFLPNGNEKSHYYVKRVIAVPGDKVQIKDGAVFIKIKRDFCFPSSSMSGFLLENGKSLRENGK